MCLKIIDKAKELIEILDEGKTKEQLEEYELVRQQGYYNMLDPRARQLTGLTEEEYLYIIKNYKELMIKFPKTKENVSRRLKYITSALIAKIIAIKGCKNCIEIVSKKLDVTIKDLCENCRKKAPEFI